MPTYLCMDGLGGNPQTTFGGLKKVLESKGHKVVLIPVNGIRTHDDRVQRVLQSIKYEKTVDHFEKIFLVGQSAGGSAVRIAAEKLGPDTSLAGIIMLSPAMPAFIFFATATLLGIMLKRVWSLIFSEEIHLTDLEHQALVSPLSPIAQLVVTQNRKPIAIQESRQLAFYPKRLGVCQCPILHLYGNRDEWVRPQAQAKLYEAMKRYGMEITSEVISGAGHLTLLSSQSAKVHEHILVWSEKAVNS